MSLEQDDAPLIAAAQADPQAFVVLYNKYVDDIYSFIYYRCGQHKETAEDLVSDVFTKAFAQIQHYEARGYSYRALLYTIARNALVDYYRVSHKQPVELDPETIHLHNVLDSSVDIKLMWAEIRTLGPDVTECYELRYLQGLSYDEIARVVGKRPGTIRTMMSRTLDQLQSKFGTPNTL